MFTLAHEMGHSMHTVLSHAHQPFVYVGLHDLRRRGAVHAERGAVPRATCSRARATSVSGLSCCSMPSTASSATFYTQVMFADFELQAHRLAEQGQPVTGEVLAELYFDLIEDVSRRRAGLRRSIALHVGTRIPHFFSTPHYVYQYATC